MVTRLSNFRDLIHKATKRCHDFFNRPLKGLVGPEQNYLVKAKNSELELVMRALFIDCYKVAHESS